MFTVTNFTTYEILSSYTLPIAPFTFIPEPTTNDTSNIRVQWDFGDGSTSQSLTAQHYYTNPGIYKVTLYRYDGDGNCISTQSRTVSAYDFIPDSFKVIPTNDTIIASHITDPFVITRFNSWQTYNTLSAEGYTFILHASGGHVPLIDLAEYNSDKFAHLKPSAKFVIKNGNDVIPVSAVTTSSTELYAAIIPPQADENIRIDLVPKGTPNSVFVGTSGTAEVYFINDFPDYNPYTGETKPFTIFVKADLTAFQDADSYGISNSYAILNKIPENFVYNTIAQPTSGVVITITSNGIDGDGYDDPTFKINASKYQGTKIPFVVRLKDGELYPSKYLPRLDLGSSIFVSLKNDAGAIPCNIEPAFGSLSSLEYGGFFKGYVETAVSANNAYIEVDIPGYGQAASGRFNIYPQSGKYSIAKINENIDFKELYKSYRFQSVLQDKNVFFDDYLGSIVGDINSSPNTLGKRVYEKIANFVDNTINVDTCNIHALKSLYDLVGADTTQFEQSNFLYPSNLGRIVDLLSIKHSVLWGTRNKFNKNFNNNGYVSSEIYGINLGRELDISTTVLTAYDGTFIVAYEKFSGNYTLCDTNIPCIQFVSSDFVLDETGDQLILEDGTEIILQDNTFVYNGNYYLILSAGQTFPLSAYIDQWGWGLVLPKEYNRSSLSAYYKFYEYIPTPDNSLVEGVINWNDKLTTLSETQSAYEDWVKVDGIMENIISHELYEGLQAFENVNALNVPNIHIMTENDRVWRTENIQYRIVLENGYTN